MKFALRSVLATVTVSTALGLDGGGSSFLPGDEAGGMAKSPTRAEVTAKYKATDHYKRSMLHAMKETAKLRRGEQGQTDLQWFHPEPRPRSSERDCMVHSCELLQSDHECGYYEQARAAHLRGLEGIRYMNSTEHAEAYPAKPGCPNQKLGHLQEMGAQFGEHLRTLETVNFTETPMSPYEFWNKYLQHNRPVHLVGAAAAWVDVDKWNDDFFHQQCNLTDGNKWYALIERNNRITQNDRHPLMYDWGMCDFIENYGKPEYKNMLYVVTPLSQYKSTLREHITLPEVLRCSEVYDSLHEARMWMSGGNTTSSLHFDTHDNLMLQIDGEKDLFFWHVNDSHLFYLDYHNKFGLSPINVDRVDLDAFPKFADSRPWHVRLKKGDAVFLPDGWWHLVRSHKRNIAVAMEVEPYVKEMHAWSHAEHMRYTFSSTSWAEQVRTKYNRRQKDGPGLYSRANEDKTITCEELQPAGEKLIDTPWIGIEDSLNLIRTGQR